MFKKAFTVLAGTMVAAAVCAAGASQLRSDHPDSYTVRRGDTLWGISAKFLAKPWLWPEIWQANPQVRNPHLIYPGDILNLSFINGGPALRLEPSVHSDDAVPAIPLDAVKTFLKDLRVMDSSVVSKAPYVVGLEEDQLDGSSGQNIYVRGLDTQPGQRWAIVRPEHVFRGYDDGNGGTTLYGDDLYSNVAVVKSPWEEDFNNGSGQYRRGKDMGLEVKVIGTAETLRTGDPTTLLVLEATSEIHKGDRLMPVDDNPYDPSFFPHAPKSLPKDGRVIAFTGAMDAVGPHQVVALSVGSADGVDNGTTFAIWQPGERIHDDVAGSSWRRGVGPHVTLPDEYIGHVMVFRTFDHVSYGLVMDGLRPVKKGDKLQLPE
ncbi:LysM peptidoglycan-binding domain-containing protein [Rhodanobacter sp. 7MK24]|uniref:LysM peptidoglycan-binding domain-containing protein n=1 Tax=Rhodanobacter sp. 7MK24 TaxID=2775922 RepID=UPI00177F521C|nr:LysM domain-containing protein [Rhodanobacter sp. 7MK24]MBD8881760.1 LysM peptidoglycan-binding domain-containing protein [Rhodanobacter sp. 7MK24]